MKVLDSVSAILKQKGGQVWSIAPDATVYDALETMADKEIGALPVIENGKIIGVLSERDYARKIILKGRSSRATKVREIMNAPAVTIAPDCTTDEAMRIVTEQRVRHLPVIDDSGLVLGVVSIGDLVKWIITSHEKTIEQLESYISGQS
ncbi:MAG: CBS domain-containing protein [Bryobacteraceae bacterium]